jgi:16S rRNA (guanine527-N7)-methyltransferase
MFHVKHSAGGGTPTAIGREACVRVEKYLVEVGFVPPLAEFLDRIERFATVLALWGARTNLTAHPEDPAEIAFHIIDSLAPLTVAARPDGSILRGILDSGRRIIDLGSGAGFPGLVLAAACDADFTLLEARRKRVSFLRVAVAEMGLTTVTLPALGETYAAFDVVVGRAFAKPAIFYKMAAQRLRAGGRAILFANAEQSLDEPAAASAKLADALRLPYELPRGNVAVARILAIWQFAA